MAPMGSTVTPLSEAAYITCMSLLITDLPARFSRNWRRSRMVRLSGSTM